MRIDESIHRIELPLGERFVCVFPVQTKEGVILVDSGMKEHWHQHIMPYMDSIGFDAKELRAILVTHSDVDHCGSNQLAVEANPRIGIWAHTGDADLISNLEVMISNRYREAEGVHLLREDDSALAWMRENTATIPVTTRLTGGEQFLTMDNRWATVLHVPGHSEGHLALWFEALATAIIGDAVLHRFVPTKEVNPAFPPTYRYVNQYLESIRILRSLRLDTMLTSHYKVLRGPEIEVFLEESEQFVRTLDEAMLSTLERYHNGMTLKQLVSAIHSSMDIWPKGTESGLVYPLLGHLERAERLAAVSVDTTRRPAVIQRRDST